jgi:hypothetical protein
LPLFGTERVEDGKGQLLIVCEQSSSQPVRWPARGEATTRGEEEREQDEREALADDGRVGTETEVGDALVVEGEVLERSRRRESTPGSWREEREGAGHERQGATDGQGGLTVAQERAGSEFDGHSGLTDEGREKAEGRAALTETTTGTFAFSLAHSG